ncbi:DNA repair exonuclease [Lujinxingia litoralis]|uniref:DNA repair exonuclease n=1 Tax=Lujinxingia litoralis TaxID=2211119 RepID=A0A328C549_9DELT|nr:DNA repair exonuclease [Lujinxingia litoralis]RAL20936.1 DNA repair exonuclease [Lujinxingia litoralis]
MNAFEPVKILYTGDLHLGRRPSRIPSSRRGLSVATIWEAIVQAAIDHRVDLVALTGDVVDRENRYYEAIGPLECGLKRLREANIATYAVSGNHDFDVLSKLHRVLGDSHFHLLGKEGTWESALFERQGQPVLQLIGWSYPTQHVKRSPLAALPDLQSDLPTVGLLHADLDQPTSSYAPVTTSELAQHPVAAWLLGHIHAPQEHRTPSNGLILYPGSPQPLHPGEPGAHGPWLVEVGASEAVQATHLPLASLRYRPLRIDLTTVQSEDDFKHVVPSKIREDLQSLVAQQNTLKHVVYRITLEGRTKLHRSLDSLYRSLQTDLELSYQRAHASIDTVFINTTPELDLNILARGNDPPGVLASLILDLQKGVIDASRKSLFNELRRTLEKAHKASAFSPLLADQQTRDFIKDDAITQMIIAQGLSLLDALHAQKIQEDL